MSDDKAIRAARLTLGGMLEKRRAETAKDRASGQIAPSKYLPGVPRQVHAYGGSVPHMPVARIVPSQGGSSISDWTQALTALKGVIPKKEPQAEPQAQATTGPVGAPAPTPEANGISPQAAAAMEALRASWDQPLTITSGYRDPDTNQAVGGAKGSQHLHGNAYDIDASGYTPEQRLALADAARAAGFTGFGFYDNSLHFDVGPSRAWGPSYHRDSIPDWAQDWVGDNIYASGGRVARDDGGPVDLNVERARKNIASGELPEHIQNTFDSMAERNRAQLAAHQEAMQAGAFDDTRIGDEYRAPNGSTFKITNHFMMPANRWGGREPPSMVYQGHVPMVSTVYTDPKMKGFDMNRAVEHVKQMERIGGPLRVVKADGGSVADRSPMFEGMSEHMRDEEGKPLELWHGTPGQPFEAFDDSKIGARDPGFYGRGHYLTPDRGVAEAYADPDEMGRGSVMGPMHAALKNPYVWDVSDEQKSHRTLRDLQSMGIMTGQGKIEPWDNLQRHHIGPFMAEMKRRGHDGVIYKTGHGVKEIVVFNPNSIKHRDAEVGDPEDPRIMRADGGRLYSKAAKIVRGLKDQKMDAADILKYAAGKGAKKAELDYVNVPPGKTTPSQVAEHIERNQPRIDVVRRGEAAGLTPDEEREFSMMTAPGAPMPTGNAMDRYRELSAKLNTEPPRYARYQLPGGENYREHILTLPDHPDAYTTNSHWGDLPNPLAHIRMSDRTVMPPHEEMRGYLDRVMKHGKGIDGAVEDGVLSPQEGATLARRFGADYSPLYTAPGIEKKILHVEELQSDWNSDARRRGFRTGTEQQDYQKYVDKMRDDAVAGIDPTASPMIRQALRQKYNTMDPYMLAMKIGRQSEHNEMARRASNAGMGVPKAPYVNPDRDDWAELAMKHVLGEAAKGGYSGVTFTPDAQQSERWGGTEFKDMYDKKFPAIAQRLAQQHDPSIKASTTSITPDVTAPMIPLTDDARESIMKNGFASFRRGGYVTHERRPR